MRVIGEQVEMGRASFSLFLTSQKFKVRNVLRSENVTEPKDVIPTPRLARVIARRGLLDVGREAGELLQFRPFVTKDTSGH